MIEVSWKEDKCPVYEWGLKREFSLFYGSSFVITCNFIYSPWLSKYVYSQTSFRLKF